MGNMIHTGFGGNSPAKMSTKEIAELCEKRHGDVIRDTRVMIDALRDDADLRHVEEERDSRGYTSEFLLPKDLTLTLVSGYDTKLRHRIVQRLAEYEAANRLNDTRTPRRAVDADKQRRTFEHHLKIAGLIGLSGNQAVLSANRATAELTGVSTLAIMGADRIEAPQPEALLSPSDIGAKDDLGSGQQVNKLLMKCGLQTSFRDHKGRNHYEPTELGISMGATMQDTAKKDGNGAPIRQLRWPSSIAEYLRSRGDVE